MPRDGWRPVKLAYCQTETCKPKDESTLRLN